MREFDAEELSRMRLHQDGAMQDVCVPMTMTGGDGDDYNIPIVAYADGASLACGLRMVRPDEAMGEAEVALFEAELRLPVDTDISHLDRVRVTHRYGEVLETPLTFELAGKPRRGPSGLVLRLRLVTK